MTKTLPILLPECKLTTRHFCADCRDKRRGRSLRRVLLDQHGIGTVDTDFVCPAGRPWRRMPIPPGDAAAWLARVALVGPAVGMWMRARGKTCGCVSRQQRMNALGWSGCFKGMIQWLRAKKLHKTT